MAVMNVKQSTRAWSPAAQSSGFKPENVQNLSAGDRDKAMGQEALGDVLNKVADPNYVDPSKLRKTGNNTLDKDAFLKLMLAQMKHQDPTNPMQSHEMAAQLAQFTSLEQLNNINTTLEGMKQSQAPATSYQALNFIGKRVSGDSSKIARVAGDTNHDITFQLMGDASKVKVTVKDADGNTVRKLEFPNLKKGDNAIKWNGLTEEGVASRPGEYKVVVEAVNTAGGKVFAKTAFDGKITGINYTAQGPVLLVGTQTLRMQDVKKITEDEPQSQSTSVGAPAVTAAGSSAAAEAMLSSPQMAQASVVPAANSQAAAAAGKAMYTPPVVQAPVPTNASHAPKAAPVRPSAPAQNANVKDDNIAPAEEEESASQGNIMTDVAMSREMMNKVSNPK